MLFLMSTLPAYAAKDVGFGGVAKSLMEPTSLAKDFLHVACFIIGAAFVFASIVKYIEHRRSPTMIPLSTVFFLLVSGLVLIAIPIFTK